ncbi:MAG: TrkH family potassium uptake protein [Planctomycetota bacterium]
MNLALIARLLGGFTLFLSAAQIAPLLLAFSEEQAFSGTALDPVAGFSASIGTGLLVALLLRLLGRSKDRSFFRREALAVVGLSWILAGALGAVPYVWSGTIPDAPSAVFETISGLTTTGATVLGSADYPQIEGLPHSILLWRSMTQWLGGLGIILVFVTLLPSMGVTGKSLLQSEQIGISNDDYRPRMLDQARTLLLVYVVLTASCMLLLALAGIPWFDALCHAFTALATGGFSTRNASIAGFASPLVDVILTFFMFLAGCNFLVLASTAIRGPRAPGSMLKDPEFRLYGAITICLVAVISVSLMVSGRGFWESLRYGSFNAISVFTSTGYATDDYQRWPLLPILLLFTSMIVGASSGSTAGGLKTVRFLVACKLMAYTVRHYVRPKSVERIKVGGIPLPAEVISSALALVALWFVGIFAGTLVLSLDGRIPFLSALATSTSLLGCCGPSICQVVDGRVVGPDMGPMGAYGVLGGGTKLFLSWLMLLGRLEFLAPLALFVPSFWRR